MPGTELFDQMEIDAVTDVIRRKMVHRYSSHAARKGIYRVSEFESALAKRLGAKHALAVNNGTSALFVGLKAMGIQPGDEVIVPTFTFIATVEAIIGCGAVPVLADIDETLGMDPASVESKISPRTKAIMPVHMFGAATRLEPILEIGKKHGIPVVEDSCEVTGGTYHGKVMTYFMKSVRLGKYVVGAYSGTGHYLAEQSVNIIGEDSSCLLDDGERLFFFGGDEDISGALDPETLRHERPRSVSVVSAPLPLLDATVYITSHVGSVFDGNATTAVLLLIDAAVCLLLVIYLLILLRRKVAKPTAELMEANRRLASGETDFRLDAAKAGSREFEALYDSYNDMAAQIVSLRIAAYDMKLAEERSKLTMLRAQLKPHTFLNAITTISNMTFSNAPEEIRAYIADFARFVRYMLKTSSPWTTVEEELKNIRSYLNMQERRSPDSIHLTAECEPEAASARIPYLLLFTLVENSIKHAMTLYTPMELLIRCARVDDADFTGTRLIVEDNGDGFPPEVIEKFVEERDDPVFTKEHLGLSNVRYTLNLVYHRSDLLRLGTREGGGARVEIWIPEVPSDEAADL